MKSAFVAKPSIVGINDVNVPQVSPGDILVQMHACGICGSDVEKVFGSYVQPSMRLGHEPAGVITKIGENVNDFAVGDRVFTHHHVPCFSCHYCKHGNETMCKKYSETNISPCGLSEEYLVPEWNVSHGGVLKLPNSVSFEQASLIEPLACCIRSWKKFSFSKGDSVAVFGVGPTGMMHVMLAHAYGFDKIFGFDVNDFRLDFVRKFNVTDAIHSTDTDRKNKILQSTDGRGVDIAIVATSSMSALQDAIDMVRKGGTVLMFGVPSKGAIIQLDMGVVYSKEITICTSYAASDSDTRDALELIKTHSVQIDDLITHRYSLYDSQKAFDHARSGDNAMKIIITK
jgi:L-iditol 2-dehydrogenase